MLDTEKLETIAPTNRRGFLKWSGSAVLATGALAAACKKSSDDNASPSSVSLLPSGAPIDVGVLNYAYALEQLEAAFYAMVVASGSFATLFTTDEQSLLKDIAAHEAIHKDFFKTAITAAAPSYIIPGLTPDFTSIDFTNRAAILGAAKAFEDTGVSAYNGAGYLITNTTYLTLAGKIVSVEARHAAWIRELINPNSFVADDVIEFSVNPSNGTGSTEKSKLPSQVLPIVQKYIKETINGSGLA